MNRLLSGSLICGVTVLVCAATTAWAPVAWAIESQPASPARAAIATTPIPPVSQRFAADAHSDEVPDFRRHVEPLFGRLGCNGRACHGSFQGRGGFHLSLFGYDHVADHQSLLGSTDGRVDLKHAAESLILKKPTLTIDHEGGLRMKRGQWEYRLLLKWIEAGAKLSNAPPANASAANASAASVSAASAPPASAKPLDIQRLEVLPAEIVFRKAGETVQLRAIAHWTDGTVEDVTPICRYQSNDDALTKVDPSGLVTSLGKGDTQIVAFYDNGITPVPVFLPVSDLVGSRYPQTPTVNRIDELVLKKLRKLGITQSALSDDAEFLRRASLDVTGTLPAPDEIRTFLTDRSADKRQRKIDQLLERPAYAAWWATRLCDLTGNNATLINWVDPFTASQQWYRWMYDRLRRNVPYDQIVAGLLLADSRQPGQSYEAYCQQMATYFATDKQADFAASPTMPFYWTRSNFRKPDDMALGFCYTFLGVQMQCCQCHKHPFDRWTKQDFDSLSQFFTRVKYGVAPADQKSYGAMTAAILADDANFNGTLGARAVAKTGTKADAKVSLFATVVATVKAAVNAAVNAATNATAKADAKTDAAKTAVAKARALAMRKLNLTLAFGLRSRQGKVIPRLEVYVVPKPAKSKPASKKPAKARSTAAASALLSNAAKPDASSAKFLGGDTVDLNQYDDPRQALVDWLRANPTRYFARVIVNRVWANYFNVGIVQPTDDLNQAHPPSNPALLDYLTTAFVEHGYDLKWLQREILNSRTYQLSWQPNDTNRLDERNFSHAIPRRLPAEVAYDALRLATGGSDEWKAADDDPLNRAIGLNKTVGPGTGKLQLSNNKYALAVFGKPSRITTCDCDRSSQPSLLQTFFLQNDQETLGLIDRPNGWLSEMSAKFGRAMSAPQATPQSALTSAQKSAQRTGKARKQASVPTLSASELDGLVQEAFLRTLSREPRSLELARGRQSIREAETPKAGLSDLLWALLNTKEFIVNH